MNPEQAEIMFEFQTMLNAASGDGQKKREAGVKVLWKIDPEHEAAMFSHLNKWKHGEQVDPDSGVHPLVHLAWRALAIAWQETHREVRHGRPCPASVGGASEDPHQQRIPGSQCVTAGCTNTSVGGPLCNVCFFGLGRRLD